MFPLKFICWSLWCCAIIRNIYLVLVPGYCLRAPETLVVSWVIGLIVKSFVNNWSYPPVPDRRAFKTLGMDIVIRMSFCMLMTDGWGPLGSVRIEETKAWTFSCYPWPQGWGEWLKIMMKSLLESLNHRVQRASGSVTMSWYRKLGISWLHRNTGSALRDLLDLTFVTRHLAVHLYPLQSTLIKG